MLCQCGIILLLPLGLHMGHLWNVQPFGGIWIAVIWILGLSWLALCWSAFIFRETDRGIALTKIDESIRFILIPTLFLAAASSLAGYGPFAGDEGQRWFSAKVLVYSLTLIIGLKLRFIMREWTTLFRILAKGPDAKVEATLDKSIRFGRRIAYVYWILIATVAFFGAVKPF